MTKVSAFKHGAFNWVDLVSTNLEGAIQFYQGLFGWSAEASTRREDAYVRFTLDGLDVAGAGEMPTATQSAWNSYVNVTDLDTTLQQIKKNGGTVTMPRYNAADAGSMALIKDPTGAQLALWEAKTHIGASLVHESGTLVWNELATRNLERAERFFSHVFGWNYEDPKLAHPYRNIMNQGDMIGGFILMNEQWEGIPPHWMVYFAVDDPDAVANRAESLGGAIKVPPTNIPPGRFAVLADPQEAHFSIIRVNTDS